MLAAGLAHALAVRYDLTGDPEAASAAIEAYQLAASDARLAVFRRLHVAQAGAVLAARCGETAVSLSLYALAVELLDSAAWRGMERRDHERMLAGYTGIPSDATAIAITAGQPESGGRSDQLRSRYRASQRRWIRRVVPDLPGVAALGDTEAETLEEMRQAIEFHFGGLREDRQLIPHLSTVAATVVTLDAA